MRGPIGWFKGHLNSWDEICTDEKARLRTNNILCTLLVACISLFMMVFGFVRNDASLNFFLLGMAVVYGAMFLLQFYNPRYQRWAAWLFGATALVMTAVLLTTGAAGGLGYLWVFLVPHVAVMVVPFLDSLVYNGVLLGTVAVMMHSPLARHLQVEYTQAFRLLFPLALFFVTCCIYLAEMVRARTQARLQVTAKQLQAFAYNDPLTGACNRHALESHFGDVKKAGAAGHSFCLFDLDHFKAINDRYGHFVGDRTLRHVVQVVEGCLPADAVLYRWGGEEFLLVLKTSDQETVWQLLETIRQKVADTALAADGEKVAVTLSVGAVCAPPGYATLHDCITRADEHLYHAKAMGRNLVVLGKGLAAQGRRISGSDRRLAGYDRRKAPRDRRREAEEGPG